jgi:formylglycine-generating enzyme required for sulfatase activity
MTPTLDDLKAPVTCVSFHDIEDPGGFIEKLHTHLKSSGQAGDGKYRLPTKGEWRYSACANTTERFFFGDAMSCPWTCDPCPAAEPFVWWCGNSRGSLHPVGLKRANPFGLFDILGNAEEVTNELLLGNVSPYSTTVQTGSVTSTLGECMNERQSWDSAVSPVTGFRLARYR